MNKVIRSTTGCELFTAIVGKGKDGLDFKSVEWKKSKGDPCDKPLNQDFIADQESFELYNNDGNHLFGYFSCDSESPEELLKLSYRYLQSVKSPQVSYETDISLLNTEKARLGDTIYVIDNEFPEPLHLSARINEIKISFTNKNNNKCTFSNYKKVKSQIGNDVRMMTHEEVLDKLTDGGKYQVLYKDEDSGELLVDGNFNEISVNNLSVNNIVSPKIITAILEDTTIYVNKIVGSDDAILKMEHVLKLYKVH